MKRINWNVIVLYFLGAAAHAWNSAWTAFKASGMLALGSTVTPRVPAPSIGLFVCMWVGMFGAGLADYFASHPITDKALNPPGGP